MSGHSLCKGERHDIPKKFFISFFDEQLEIQLFMET